MVKLSNKVQLARETNSSSSFFRHFFKKKDHINLLVLHIQYFNTLFVYDVVQERVWYRWRTGG